MVRIIGRFWDDVASHQNLILRCFEYLNKKFPHPDGRNAAYSDLMAEMHRLNVFGEFDSKRKAKTYRGKNTDPNKSNQKKFEQYIFMRVHHILMTAYGKRRKYSTRFSGVSNFDGYNPETYSNVSENAPGQELNSDAPSRKKYPTIYNDLRDFVGDAAENVEDKINHDQIMERINVLISNPVEKKVLEMKYSGMAQKDIAEVIGCTTQNISIILKRIKTRVKADGLFA